MTCTGTECSTAKSFLDGQKILHPGIYIADVNVRRFRNGMNCLEVSKFPPIKCISPT